MQSKGGEILAVSTEPLATLANARKRNPAIPCILASDADGSAIRGLNLLHESLGKVGKVMSVPANVLLDKDGIVQWVHYARMITDRPDPRSVLRQVLAVGSNEALLRK